MTSNRSDRTGLMRVITMALVLAAFAAGTVFATGQTEEPLASGERPDLRIGVQALPSGFAPSMNISNVGQRINYSIYDHFIKRAYWSTPAGDGGELAPSVAESWEQISPTVWEITIRQGVRFHNGDELTAEDIAFNFSEERMWGAERMVAVGPTYFGTLASIEATGPYTVRVETREPDPAFLKRFTTPLAFVVPRDYYQELGMEEFNLAPIGTGPYRLVDFQPDEYVRLEAFNDYWGGTPPAKSITFYEIPEFAGRLTALFNGEVDLIANVSPDQISAVENRSGFEVRDVLIDNHRVMVMNTFDPVNPQMNDVRIRHALAHAIDRELIVDQLWQGYSKVPVIGVFAGHAEYYLEEREPFPYDPERARRLLAEAGYDGEEFLYGINGGYYVNYLESAQIMQEMWKEVGINVRIEIRETGNLDEPFDLASWSDGMQMNDPLHTVWATYGPTTIRGREGSRRQIWVPTPEYLELGSALNTTIEFDARRDAFERIVEHFENEMVSLPLFQAVEFYAIRSDIAWKPYSFWPMDLGPNNLQFPSN